jgi:plastocyanin
MTRRRVVALMTIAVVFTATFSSVALGARKHRLKLPPRPAFPRALSVDETEFQLGPSRTVVSSGRVRINVYNRGMDDHDLVVYDQSGTELGKSFLLPGASDQIVVTLPAGDYRVVCSLFAGTPVSHESYGMRFTLRVQDPPIVAGALLPTQRR